MIVKIPENDWAIIANTIILFIFASKMLNIGDMSKKELKTKSTMNGQIKISNDLIKQEEPFVSTHSDFPDIGFSLRRIMDLKMFLYILSKIKYHKGELPKERLHDITFPVSEFVSVYELDSTYKTGRCLTEIKKAITGLRSLGVNYHRGSCFISANFFSQIVMDSESNMITATLITDNLGMFNGTEPYKVFEFIFCKSIRNIREFNFYLWLKKYEQPNHIYPNDIKCNISEFKKIMELREKGDIRFYSKPFRIIKSAIEKRNFLRNFFGLNAKNGKDGYLERFVSDDRLKTTIVDFINSTDLNLKISLTGENKDILHFHVSSKNAGNSEPKKQSVKPIQEVIPADQEPAQAQPSLHPANPYYIRFVGMNLEEFFNAIKQPHQELEPFVANQLPLIEKDGFGFVNGIFTILAGFKIMG